MPKAGTNAGDPAAREPPTLGQLGMARLVGRCCRLIVGAQVVVVPKAPANTLPAGGAIFSVAQRKIKLSSILSQVDESESGMMSEQGMVACYMRCSALYKGDESPPKESEPTVEQLSALKHPIDSGSPPYCDFSIWGPYVHRLVKKIKLSGYNIGRGGKLQLVM